MKNHCFFVLTCLLFSCLCGSSVWPQNGTNNVDPGDVVVLIDTSISAGPSNLPITKEQFNYIDRNYSGSNPNLRSAYGLTVDKVSVSGPSNVEKKIGMEGKNSAVLKISGNGISASMESGADYKLNASDQGEKCAPDKTLSGQFTTEVNPTLAVVDYSKDGVSIREIDGKGNFKLKGGHNGSQGNVDANGNNSYRGKLATDASKGYNIDSERTIKQDVNISDPKSVSGNGSLAVKDTASVIPGQPTTLKSHTEHRINIQNP